VPFTPQIVGVTFSDSTEIATFQRRYERGKYRTPEFQRDSEQWDLEKKSLFIDSLINHLSIPPLTLFKKIENEQEYFEIIDGQQRAMTIVQFLTNEFQLSSEEDVEYSENIGPLIHGRNYESLTEDIKNSILDYKLNFVILPEMSTSQKLETFRRINEAGVPLSPQDLRLAEWGDNSRAYFIRLAGIFDRTRTGSNNAINSAATKFQLDYPWQNTAFWSAFWDDTAKSIGQYPSQVFLIFIIARNLISFQTLIDSEAARASCGVRYDKTMTSVLDLFLAQLNYEDKNAGAAKILPTIDIIKADFINFESWFNAIKGRGVVSIQSNSSLKIVFFIAGAIHYWETPDKVTDAQWEEIQYLLTKGPEDIKRKFSTDFTIAKGKWPGVKQQINDINTICNKIKNP